MLKLNTPLELITGHTLDDEQQKYIKKHNALDLVLIENANEMIRLFLQSDGIFEEILDYLQSKYPGTFYLPTESFNRNLRDRHETIENYCEHNSTDFSQYKFIISIYALKIQNAGHYASFFVNVEEKSLYIFDSMQTFGGKSIYSNEFIELGKEIFVDCFKIVDPNNIKVFEYVNSYFKSLQPTGGFFEGTPAILRYLNIKLPSKTLKEIKYQHINSQDHFCYMWAFWMLNLFLENADFVNIFDEIEQGNREFLMNTYGETIHGLIPLVIIKRYTYCMIKILGETRFKKFLRTTYKSRSNFYYKFFKKHFFSMWHNPDPTDAVFYRYNFKCKDDDDCLKDSIKECDIYKHTTPNPYLENIKLKLI